MAKTVLGKDDLYSQMASSSIDMALTANLKATEVFTTAYSAKDKIGWVIEKVEYYMWPDEYVVLDANGLAFSFGLGFYSDVPTVLWGPADDGILDFNDMTACVVGTEGARYIAHDPFKTKTFTNLRGGGILTHPSITRLWACNGAIALGSLYKIEAVLTYYEIALTPELYTELFQSLWSRAV